MKFSPLGRRVRTSHRAHRRPSSRCLPGLERVEDRILLSAIVEPKPHHAAPRLVDLQAVHARLPHPTTSHVVAHPAARHRVAPPHVAAVAPGIAPAPAASAQSLIPAQTPTIATPSVPARSQTQVPLVQAVSTQQAAQVPAPSSQTTVTTPVIITLTPPGPVIGDPPTVLPSTPRATTGTVAFNLAQTSLTSAGVFDGQGRLVRTLWTMQSLAGGSHTAEWDGLDDFGNSAAAGRYTIRVAINGSTYQNVGAIGQNPQSPTTTDHIPTSFYGVAVDPSGAIYTANNWDEPGADFSKWDTSGNTVYSDQTLMRSLNPPGTAYHVATDSQYLYFVVEAWTPNPAGGYTYQDLIERYNQADGSAAPFAGSAAVNGNIVVQNPAPDASTVDSLAVSGQVLYVADRNGNRVLEYDKATGQPLGQFSAPQPTALAVDGSGRIWVGQGSSVSVYNPDGSLASQPISGLGNVVSLSFGPGGQLYAADEAAGQVEIYATTGTSAQLSSTFGQKAQPGASDSSHFFDLKGAAVDPQGNLVTVELQAVEGAEIAKWSPSGTLLWMKFSNEGGGTGTYGQDNPNAFYSMSLHQYTLNAQGTGTWQNVASVAPSGTSYSQAPRGVPRILNVGGKDYFFAPTGDGLQVYRVDNGAFHLVTLVGGNSPAPDGTSGAEPLGEWSWSDTSGSGQPLASQINWYQPAGQGTYHTSGMNVDAEGNLWFADSATRAVWELPLGSPDALGNPTYNWAQAHIAVPADNSTLRLVPNAVQHAADGSTYVLGWSNLVPHANGAAWMGGSTLVKYDAQGNVLWAVALPEICVGLDDVPGGGVMVGSSSGGGVVGGLVYQYTADGLLLGTFSPGAAMAGSSGWFDSNAGIVVDRNPQTGLLDVFTEDVYNLRIGWYQVDDRGNQELSFPVAAPAAPPAAPANVTATPFGPGQALLNWSAVPGAGSYLVQRSQGTNGVWTTIADVTGTSLDGPSTVGFSDAGLASSTTYGYRILARNGAGTSAAGAAVTVVTQATSPSAIAPASVASGTTWTVTAGTWMQTGGLIQQTDPTVVAPQVSEALLKDQVYPSNATITAKLRVDTWGGADGLSHAGVGLNTDTATGNGYDLVFVGTNAVQFLDGTGTSGNSYSFNWSVGTWYWFKLSDQNGTLLGKVWADGTPEPSSWTFEQDGWTDHTSGAPALNGGSGHTTASFLNVSVSTALPTPTGPLGPSWSLTAGTWALNGGLVQQTDTTVVNPQTKKALLTDQAYPAGSTITAKVRVDSWSGDGNEGAARAGVGLDTDSSTGDGYNLIFSGANTVEILDDHFAWGNSYTFSWSVGTSYWFALSDAGGKLLGKVWADGTPEPSSWMFEQDGWINHASGTPALNAGVGNSTVSFSNVAVTSPASLPTSTPTPLGAGWTTSGGQWVRNDGLIQQTDPSNYIADKAILTGQTYPADATITAKVRVDSWPGDGNVAGNSMARAGVGLDTDPSTGYGYSLVFSGPGQVKFLYDLGGWSQPFAFNWSVGTWYWFKFQISGGQLQGKIWADGTPEPSSWMFVQSAWKSVSGGAPSLNGSSGNATVSFADVSVS